MSTIFKAGVLLCAIGFVAVVAGATPHQVLASFVHGILAAGDWIVRRAVTAFHTVVLQN